MRSNTGNFKCIYVLISVNWKSIPKCLNFIMIHVDLYIYCVLMFECKFYTEHPYVSRMISGFSSDKKLNKFQKQALIQATMFICLLQRGFRIRGLTKKEILKLQLRHEMSISSQQHLQHELQKSASSHSFGLPHSHSFSGRIVFDQANSSIINNNEMVRFLLFQIIDLFNINISQYRSKFSRYIFR